MNEEQLDWLLLSELPRIHSGAGLQPRGLYDSKAFTSACQEAADIIGSALFPRTPLLTLIDRIVQLGNVVQGPAHTGESFGTHMPHPRVQEAMDPAELIPDTLQGDQVVRVQLVLKFLHLEPTDAPEPVSSDRLSVDDLIEDTAQHLRAHEVYALVAYALDHTVDELRATLANSGSNWGLVTFGTRLKTILDYGADKQSRLSDIHTEHTISQ